MNQQALPCHDMPLNCISRNSFFMTLWHCQLHCRFAFSDHLLEKAVTMSRRPLINASTPIRPTGRSSQDFTDAVQSSSALRKVNGTDTAHHWQLSEWVESRDWNKLYCKFYASKSFKVYQNHGGQSNCYNVLSCMMCRIVPWQLGRKHQGWRLQSTCNLKS